MKPVNKFLRLLLVITGLLGILDTIAISIISNMNLGVVLPAIIGTPLILYGIFCNKLRPWMKKGFGRVVKIFFRLGYAVFILLFLVCAVIMGVHSESRPEGKVDALIVLGGGVKGDVATITVKTRLDTALPYLKENPGCIVVVSGGQGPEETTSEAKVMAAYLKRSGIEETRIILEDQSTSTRENLIFSREKLDAFFQNKPYRVAVVTNDFHIYRAELTAKSAGFAEAQGMASPSPLYLQPNNYLRETVAIVKTWVLGVE